MFQTRVKVAGHVRSCPSEDRHCMRLDISNIQIHKIQTKLGAGKTACGGKWEILGADLDDLASIFFRVLSAMSHC